MSFPDNKLAGYKGVDGGPANPPRPAKKKSSGAAIISGADHISKRSPGKLGHNRGLSSGDRRHYGVDSNSPKSNSR